MFPARASGRSCASYPSAGRLARPSRSLCLRPVACAASCGDVTVGLDFGTSGARVMAVDAAGQVVADGRREWSSPDECRDSEAWTNTLWALLESLPAAVRARTAAVAIDGTSASCLLVEERCGRTLTTPLMYNDSCAEQLPTLRALAPEGHTVCASTSTLAKLLRWQSEGLVSAGAVLEHQADFLAAALHGRRASSDWHNALKLGYDPGVEAWPQWLRSSTVGHALPRHVLRPGSRTAQLTPATASRLGMPPCCFVAGGTTDSIAAYVAAAGVAGLTPGDAVSSLGSTLAVKLLSASRVDVGALGVYSHRLGDAWLVGGASNVGGAVLRSLFGDDARLNALTSRIDATVQAFDGYYPLLKAGERFPVCDPSMQPVLEPRPQDDALYLHGLLESIARIEKSGYDLLTQYGAPRLRRVITAGGGAQNVKWTAIRQRRLGVPVTSAPQGEAAYGAALLARGAL